MNEKTCKENMGREGEDAACEVLRQRGYRVIARNWSCRFGEIDIIARQGDVLAFVEVKVRSRADFGGASAAVTPRKQARIIAAARCFFSQTQSDLPARFDVVAIDCGKVRLIQAAFEEDRCLPGR
ncbi:YraN family protein [Candidatus Bipolaricaulota bacterium]|nr:YraN family protein [Candidatus Bipolaricaulota bacterium]